MNMERKKLSDILPKMTNLKEIFDNSKTADESGPMPAGEYVCHAVEGRLFNAQSGTPGYKVTFKVIEGEFASRRVWLDCWLTEAALPMTKRDLSKLGIVKLGQCEKALPPGLRCEVRVALRQNDKGDEYNVVKTFKFVGLDAQVVDEFAPKGGVSA